MRAVELYPIRSIPHPILAINQHNLAVNQTRVIRDDSSLTWQSQAPGLLVASPKQ